ncbi:hypothetical protein T484DRAFT_1881275 [Baffinella frigidus]|nr:hypothetical protein T484DRAFT_1881275 [Cryptophyta sp. CCMP2293]
MAAAKTAITMKSSLSRIIAAKRNRALKAAELPPPFEAWKIIPATPPARSRLDPTSWAWHAPPDAHGLQIACWREVEITAGKDKGKQGEVMKVFRRNQRVMVQGLNLSSFP